MDWISNQDMNPLQLLVVRGQEILQKSLLFFFQLPPIRHIYSSFMKSWASFPPSVIKRRVSACKVMVLPSSSTENTFEILFPLCLMEKTLLSVFPPWFWKSWHVSPTILLFFFFLEENRETENIKNREHKDSIQCCCKYLFELKSEE